MLTNVASHALALLPVLIFLLVLVIADAHRLVRPWLLAGALVWGAAAAAGSYAVNGHLAAFTGARPFTYGVFVSPLVEEALKALLLVILLTRRRIGFLVDALVLGFAVGAGFALVENVFYLATMGARGGLLLWALRGFGTALMHGGSTAVLALLGRLAVERSARVRPLIFLPPLLVAAAAHGLYNRSLLRPELAVGAVVAVLPLAVAVVYRMGERRLQRWLGAGFDLDATLLARMQAGEVLNSPVGRYVDGLRRSFRGDDLVDMLCVLRLQAELSLRARGQLIMRQHGFGAPLEEETRRKLDELRELEHRLGRAGRLALRPLTRWGRGEEWERRLLEG